MPSFDVVSKVELQEVNNAVDSVTREINQRYDFKGSKSNINFTDDEIIINADDNYKLGAIGEMLKAHITRRKGDVKSLDFQKAINATGNTLRQTIKIKQGIEADIAKKITKEIKSSKMKIQASIRGEELRIEGKKRDDLQEAIDFIKKLDIDIALQFINFRD